MDGYISREMVRRANNLGFQLAHIHDSYWTHPKYMNQVRELYKELLIEIAKSNLLEDILYQLTGGKIVLEYSHPELWEDMLDAEYMLS